MNKLQGYIFGTVLMLSFIGCNKEEEPTQEVPTCQCYDTYENLEAVFTGGQVQMVWVVDYETTPSTDFCSNASDYEYNANNTTRWKTTCQ